MRAIAVISSDKEINDRISKICTLFAESQFDFQPFFLEREDQALEFLKYELPEAIVINYSDKNVNVKATIDAIKGDQWLHYGCIIGVHTFNDARECNEALKSCNTLATLSRKEFVQGFYRILRIISQNRQIIFQRDLHAFLMKQMSGTLVMDNDPLNVRIYANLISNYLYSCNYINSDVRDRLHVAIHEMLMNAVEHGNCEISYEEKTRWLETHGEILELIREKLKSNAIAEKKVWFSYRISEERSIFTIRDEGTGFDWRAHIAGKDQSTNFGLHGRGIVMTGAYVRSLTYNEVGNEVSFEVEHQKNESNVLPSIFTANDEVRFHDGEYIFREGETSDHLYYIVSGVLEIYRGDRYVTRLSPDDMFLGEMSFLLANRRSASVVSRGESLLVPVSKNSFVNIIKEQPHYGIFLARLLAHRLERMNTTVARLSKDKSSVL